MLEVNDVIIPDLTVFSGWDLPEAIDVFYYEDPETKNKKSSGFAVSYPISKKGLMTDEWRAKLKEFKIESITIHDNSDPLGTLETIYQGLTYSSIEEDDEFITIGFTCDNSITYLKFQF